MPTVRACNSNGKLLRGRVLKILQLKTSASRGGAETLLLQLTQAFTTRGHTVTTIVGEKGWLNDRFVEANLTVRSYPMTTPSACLHFATLLAEAKNAKPQVVLCHGARVSVFGTILSLLLRVPLVTVEHNVDDWRERAYGRNEIDRWVGRRSKRRIAVSEAVAAMLRAKHIVNPEKLIVIANGCAVAPLEDSVRVRQQVRDSLRVSDEELLVVTVARCVEQKGHRFLVEAIPRVLRVVPKARFLFVGDGPLRPAIEAEAEQALIGDKLQLVGAVDNVREILAGADLFVLPSLWEGLPLALLEAMLSGVPVVATRVGGVPEVIRDGVNGIVVPPGSPEKLAEAITGLLRDSERRQALARTGEADARRNHSVDRMSEKYLEVLESCIS